MTHVHLICGAIGAGKTTCAMRLAREVGAVRFTVDEWMATLFMPGAPDPISYRLGPGPRAALPAPDAGALRAAHRTRHGGHPGPGFFHPRAAR